MSRIDENGFLAGPLCHWIAEYRDQHATGLTAIRELNRACHRFLDGLAVDVTSELHTTTAVLFARLMELFQGIVITSEYGMTAVRNVVFRAYLEAYFLLMAIHKDPTFLRQYLDQLHIDRKKLVNRIRSSSSPDLAQLREELDDSLAQEIQQTITEQGIKPLTTETIARRADRHDIYATAYAILSGAAHATAWDLESHLDYDDTQQAIPGFKYGPSDANTAFLWLAGLSMTEALETLSSIFNEDRSQLCAGLTSQFEALLEERPA